LIFDENLSSKKKTVAVIQSNYIPWVGYFAIMAEVDLFLVYECVKYTKNDWRNRNQIEDGHGHRTWLTIPVTHKNLRQSFMETRVATRYWARSHFSTLNHHFAQAPGWKKFREELKTLYEMAGQMDYLYEVNRLFLGWLVEKLQIKTEIKFLSNYPEFSNPTERLVSVLKNFEATQYISGPSGKNYIDSNQFEDAKIKLIYADYQRLIPKFYNGTNDLKITSALQLILEEK
jgi:hypothetical protein